MDAAIGVSKDNWNAEFYVVNLTDEDTSMFTTAAQFILAEVPIRPRTMGLRFGYSFDGTERASTGCGPAGQPAGPFSLRRPIPSSFRACSPTASPTQHPPRPISRRTCGDLQRLIEQQRFDEALGTSERLLREFPRHRDLLYMRAVALRHLQRVPEALATLERLEDAHPGLPEAVPGARPLPRVPAPGA